ncbi:MAG: HigA family addiction module antidote protein [Bacteroidetes bacterium]|nr:HigA family addiction module antidote protein [Bacteroidota bacterium]MCH8524495.1 HigA family addiction module antidote protein [Balneolales bacterium]
MEKLSNVHPGEILLHEFLEPLGVSAYRLSKDLNIPQTRLSQIINRNS